jgi:CheY-like chemotaxis protein
MSNEIHMTPAAPPLIVYAEDDADTREIIAILLRREGFRVETTTDAEGLIDTVNRLCESDDCPDLILSDVNFFNSEPRTAPKLTGIGAAFQIHRKFPNLPILFLTAHADPLTRQNAREAVGQTDGAAPVIAKPAFPGEIVSRVRDALRLTACRYEGEDRRRYRVNRSGQFRRRTDRRVEVSSTVSEVLSEVKGVGR